MPAKKHINTNATLYDGEFMFDYTCVGPEICKYALCPVMPPDGSEDCTYYDYGNCLCSPAKYAALESLRNRLTRELKQLKEDIEEA